MSPGCCRQRARSTIEDFALSYLAYCDCHMEVLWDQCSLPGREHQAASCSAQDFLKHWDVLCFIECGLHCMLHTVRPSIKYL